MHYSTLTRRGQTTVPKAVRERLRLEPGQRVAYRLEGDRVYLEAQPKGAESLYGALADPAGGGGGGGSEGAAEPAGPPDAAAARDAARRGRVGRYA